MPSERAVRHSLRVRSMDCSVTERTSGTSASEDYAQRRPEKTVLYRAVAKSLETFLAWAAERNRIVPGFVEQELRDFLDCGVFANGLVRVHCTACGFDRLVALSCKRRGYAKCWNMRRRTPALWA